MKFSFMNLGCPNWDLDTVVARAVEYGYDGVELRSHSDNDVMFPNPPLSYRKHVKKLFADNNLEISGIAAYSKFCESDEKILEENKQILVNDIILAHDLGAPVVRSFLGESKTLTHEQVLEAAAPYLNYCGDFAQKLGVTVAFETHDVWCGAALMQQVFSHITSKGIAILWDVGNNHSVGELVDPFFSAVGDKVVHIHMKDHFTKDGKREDCIPGLGDVEIKRCLELLHKSGFKGHVSFEWEKRWIPSLPEPEIALPAYIKLVKGFMAEIE